MIEDKELGLKIAENEYEKLATSISQQIQSDELKIEINKVIVDYCKRRAKEWKKEKR